jgi:DNA-binding XRE family transcriptional regulator
VPNRLAELRTAAFMTQSGLAAEANVGVATICRIEAEHEVPQNRTIKRLAKALGVKPQDIFPDPEQLRTLRHRSREDRWGSAVRSPEDNR